MFASRGKNTAGVAGYSADFPFLSLEFYVSVEHLHAFRESLFALVEEYARTVSCAGSETHKSISSRSMSRQERLRRQDENRRRYRLTFALRDAPISVQGLSRKAAKLSSSRQRRRGHSKPASPEALVGIFKRDQPGRSPPRRLREKNSTSTARINTSRSPTRPPNVLLRSSSRILSRDRELHARRKVEAALADGTALSSPPYLGEISMRAPVHAMAPREKTLRRRDESAGEDDSKDSQCRTGPQSAT